MDVFNKLFGHEYYKCEKIKKGIWGGYRCHGPYKSFEEADRSEYSSECIESTLLEVRSISPKFIKEYFLSFQLRPSVSIIDKHNNITT